MSENAKAFRARLDGLVQEHAAGIRAIEQRWKETAAAAEKSAADQVGKAQKLVARVRERSESLRNANAKGAIQEINAFGEQTEPEETDPEVERLSQQLVTRQQHAQAVAEPAATEPAQSAPAAAHRPAQAADFGRVVETPQPPAAGPNPGWQVQAGRFGRQGRQQAAPPAAEPQRPSASPPAQPPRRKPEFDEDDDFENRSWLR